MEFFIKNTILLIFILSCERNNPSNNVYSEWKNLFHETNYETHFYISSMTLNNDDNLIFSAYIRRDNFTIDCTGIFKCQWDTITSINSSQFSDNFDNIMSLGYNSNKSIWYNNDILISYNPNDNICCTWQISDINNERKVKSSKFKIDGNGNIWEASTDGLNMFNGDEWITYFQGNSFYSIAIDKSNKMYCSTLPDYEEPGIILTYNNNEWDTLIICSGNEKWVPCMNFDNNNNLWFGVLSRGSITPESGDGLFMYNNEELRCYNINNSDLPSNSVIDIFIDKNDNKWIGMYSGGFAKLDNNMKWKIFNSENTPLPFDNVEHIIIDDDENIWLAVQYYGLAKFKE